MRMLGYILTLLVCVSRINGQVCVTNTDIFGVNSPISQSNRIEYHTNTGYILLGSGAQSTIDCCGTVSSWEAFIDNQNLPQQLYFQVWRPQGATYTLVGENQFTADITGEITFTPSTGSAIAIVPGDRFGWYWYSATNVIKHKNTNGADNTYKTFASKPTVGDTEDWVTGITVESGRTYALRLDTDAGSTPYFTSPTDGQTFSIFNYEAVGTLITTVVYGDNDVGDTLTSTSTLQAGTAFAYNTVSGDVAVNSATLAPGTETLTFSVSDFCGNSETISITVTIINEAPVIYGLPQSIELSEDYTAEQLLYTVNATDSADGFTCDFSSNVPAAWPFVMRQVPGTSDSALYVETNPGFDYNTKNSYAMEIECTDDHGAVSDPGIYMVYLKKNQAPVVHNLQAATVVSTTSVIGTTVFTVNVTDAENDQISMSMTCDPPLCPFQIFDSGAIQLTQDISNHVTTGYDVNVTVTDGKNTVGPKILTIIVKDINDPVLISNLALGGSLPVRENSAVGTSVYTVSISDQDNQNITYTMSPTPATGLTYFTIHQSTGVIRTTSSIDYESIPATSFTFLVSVNDGAATDVQPLVIDVINSNEPPAFSQTTYSLSANEGPANSVLGTPVFGVTDPDNGDTAVYSMDCGADTARFFMDSNSGQISFQSAYDTDSGSVPTSVTCSVTVTDSGDLNDTATLNIFISDINDNTPFFAPASYTDHVSYYASVGSSILTVTASDFDIGTFGSLTYTLNQSGFSDQYFSIDNSGVISVLRSMSGLGYATSVSFTVTATDGGGLTATAPVTITISDSTTTSTTTTTDRYRKFTEDPRNLVWIVAASVLLGVIFGTLGWVVYTCRGDKGWTRFIRHFCKKKRKTYRPRLKRYRPTVRTPRTTKSKPPLPAPPKVVNVATIRHPPPPVGQQQWRTSLEAAAEPTRAKSTSYDFWKHTDFTQDRLTKLL